MHIKKKKNRNRIRRFPVQMHHFHGFDKYPVPQAHVFQSAKACGNRGYYKPTFLVIPSQKIVNHQSTIDWIHFSVCLKKIYIYVTKIHYNIIYHNMTCIYINQK